MVETSPRRRKVRFHGEDRRRQILDVAGGLFARCGYEGASIKEIADACDVSQAMLYRHFPSKEKLYLSVVEDKILQLDNQSFLANLDKSLSLEELLRTLALQILAMGERDPEINRLLLFGTLKGSGEASELFRVWRQPFVDYIEKELAERKRRGEIRNVDPHITARSFVGMLMDCSVSCFLWPEFGYEEFDPEKAIANNVGVFVRGLES